MNAVIPYAFEGKQVRTVVLEKEPWWVGKDVADVLGYANHNDAIKQHCKGVAKRYPLQTPGGVQEVRIINEGDVFRLIVSSTLPEAQRFEKWLFEEALPAIRKTGPYAAQPLRNFTAAEMNLIFGGDENEPLNIEHCIILLRELHKNMGPREANACFKKAIGYEPPRRSASGGRP